VVCNSAGKVKADINAQGIMQGKLIDTGFGRDGEENDGALALCQELEKIRDEIGLETLCGMMKESWGRWAGWLSRLSRLRPEIGGETQAAHLEASGRRRAAPRRFG
jgi:hypothetical protein